MNVEFIIMIIACAMRHHTEEDNLTDDESSQKLF